MKVILRNKASLSQDFINRRLHLPAKLPARGAGWRLTPTGFSLLILKENILVILPAGRHFAP
jgi:hypothetical protein